MFFLSAFASPAAKGNVPPLFPSDSLFVVSSNFITIVSSVLYNASYYLCFQICVVLNFRLFSVIVIIIIWDIISVLAVDVVVTVILLF